MDSSSSPWQRYEPAESDWTLHKISVLITGYKTTKKGPWHPTEKGAISGSSSKVQSNLAINLDRAIYIYYLG